MYSPVCSSGLGLFLPSAFWNRASKLSPVQISVQSIHHTLTYPLAVRVYSLDLNFGCFHPNRTHNSSPVPYVVAKLLTSRDKMRTELLFKFDSFFWHSYLLFTIFLVDPNQELIAGSKWDILRKLRKLRLTKSHPDKSSEIGLINKKRIHWKVASHCGAQKQIHYSSVHFSLYKP